MRTVTALQVALCGLFLTLCLVEGQVVFSEDLADPPPIDCVWSRWSEWSVCDPCKKEQRRSRSIMVFGQFNGRQCRGSLGERQACMSSDPCVQPTPAPCSDTEFECTLVHQCIKKRLECNGDEDCEDGTDEDCVVSARKPCGQLELINSEQSRRAGYGVNPLSTDPRQNPFNNDYFGGRCERVRNPANGITERIPFNVGVFNYRTIVTETVSREIYEDSSTVLNEVLNDITNKFDFGVNVKFGPSEPTTSPPKGSAAAADSKGGGSPITGQAGFTTGVENKNLIKNITEYTKIKNKSFIRVKGSIQLSTYRMRSNDLQVAEDFVSDIKRLPLEYEKSIYFSFLEDYGTHYTKNGKHGGNYDLVYVLNQDTIEEKKIGERTIQECVKVGVSAEAGSGGIEGSGSFNNDNCKALTTKDGVTTSGKAVVDKVVSAIYGGSAAGAAGIKSKLSKDGILDIFTFQEWARSLGEEPTLLDSDPEPIYSLVPLHMPNANTIVSNIKRASAEYVGEYSSCKCRPCKNGGTPALVDGECLCLCPRGYGGLACQNYKVKSVNIREIPTVPQIGNWACWSGYTPCVGGTRSRSRQCNTEGLRGATCVGESRVEEYC